jgi:hypothetical protein
MPLKFFTGLVRNKGSIIYADDIYLNSGSSPLVFGQGDKAATLINDGTFELSGQFASLTSYDPNIRAASVGSKFINNGTFRRLGAGRSTIQIDFQNNGRLDLLEGDLFFYIGSFDNQGLIGDS